MAFSNWICTNSTKNLFLKIVHPGGHVELHDRPVLAAEIILRNPRCCVAHPNIFRQPWAIVTPDTTLMPGQKFYVVPIGTIRRLQKHSLRRCPNSLLFQEIQTSQIQGGEGGDEDRDDKEISTCWLFVNKKNGKRLSSSDDDNCFTCLLPGIKVKASSEESSVETRSGSSETVGLTRKGGSPKRLTSLDHWQPRLESISEELKIECN